MLSRVLEWDVGAGWYVFAIGYIPAIKLLVALVHRLALSEWPRFGQEALYVIVAALLVSTWVQAGEEIGWRGYALPRLSERLGECPWSWGITRRVAHCNVLVDGAAYFLVEMRKTTTIAKA